MDDNLKKLKEIETDLVLDLEQNPTFKQLEVIRNAILTFSNGQPINGVVSSISSNSSKFVIPPVYDVDLTWGQKIIFVVNKLKNAFVSDIVSELQKLGEKDDEATLLKKVGVGASDLKKKGKLGAKSVGKKSKYFIK